tara:strand:- start:1167 stop:1670 length:504 start_codon:yes stop_codon:yes gene_type:complete
MMPQFDESLINRYRGIVELAAQGEGGEKANAQKIVGRLRQRHPGIHMAAYPPDPPVEPEEYGGFGPSNLRDIFDRVANQMRNGATWAAQAAYEAMQIETARAAALDTFEIRSKILASDKWQVAAKIHLDQLEALSEDFTPVQAEVFADTIADLVREEVMAALGYEIE